ncbi:putative peptidase S10, serine carboxypeptidase, alpha/Beta hydrolase [Rosa chinensis]|uniref:Putative peptidase S10, serine carboxypeptidase, alpha/Beta hydrolase n=1 Tax=Rosa chinensis TaxID=74649 RepID=A0A2P6PK68_ROSCH|nr:putative peptidase S10, serine carboxypeptidase, alpha/Beta hydrolase [Rosa chinensis]
MYSAQGYVLGNPVTDEERDQNSQVLFAYLKALISHELYQSIKSNCRGEYVNVDPNNALCVYDLELVNECIQGINLPHILEPECTIKSPKPIGREWDPRDFSNKELVHSLLQFPQVSRPWCRVHISLFILALRPGLFGIASVNIFLFCFARSTRKILKGKYPFTQI